MKKSLLFIIPLALILIVVGIVGKNKGWFGAEKLSKVAVEEIINRNIIETVTANGKIYPENEVKISSDVSGEIIELYVELGDTVKVGQKLARVKPDSYQALRDQTLAQLNGAKADLATARARESQAVAQVEQAQDLVNRNNEILKKNAGLIAQEDVSRGIIALKSAQADLEAARQNINAAEFRIKSAEARTREANSDVSKTTIYAPLSGIVSILNVEQGEKVVGTLQMQGTEMMRIADFQFLEIRVDVSENDIIRVNRKDTAIIEVDAYNDQTFKGIVTKIATASNGLGRSSLSQINQSTNFEVQIRILPSTYVDLLEKYDYPFRPGMSATVDIQTERKTNVLAAPIQSVTTRTINDSTSAQSNQLQTVLFVNEGGVANMKKVKTGIQNDEYIEILEGIDSGVEIISEPYGVITKILADEMQVDVVKRKNLYE